MQIHPLRVCNDELDGHHAFVVRYRVEGAGDMDLAPHRDDSEVTFNLALGRRWAGCELTFCGLMQDQDVYHHRLSHKFPGPCVDSIRLLLVLRLDPLISSVFARMGGTF